MRFKRGTGVAVKIGELARRTAVSERSLRYYEEQGLLVSERTAGGHRVYGEADLARSREVLDDVTDTASHG